MKSFYTQQILATLAVTALWAGGIFTLSKSEKTTPSHIALVTPEKLPEDQAKLVTEPRDPAKTGETSRVHHRDGYGNERKTEITFADKTHALVEYSVFGKPGKVTETRSDGSSQVFRFDPMKGELKSIESLRADGTVAIRSEPVNGSLQRTFYQPDGKTLRCKQTIQQAKTVAEIYSADGKLEARYEETASGEGVEAQREISLKVFDKAGKLQRQETISRKSDELSMAEYMHDGEAPESLTVKTYWANGKIRSEQEWLCYGIGSSAQFQSGTDYNENGVKTRAVSSCYEKFGNEYSNFRVEFFDADLKVQRTAFVTSDFKVLKQTTLENGTLKESTPSKEVLKQSPATPPSLFSYTPEFFRAQLEENHLRQIFSE